MILIKVIRSVTGLSIANLLLLWAVVMYKIAKPLTVFYTTIYMIIVTGRFSVKIALTIN